MQASLRTHELVFSEDKNLGLISYAMKQHEMTRIAALGETYLVISVADVACKLYGSKSPDVLAEAVQRLEHLVLQMVIADRCFLD